MLLVSNLQRFSLHDGPGIRTTVFLKGCPFSCPWCCNPENLLFAKQVYFRAQKCIRQNASSCDRCRILLRSAGVGAPKDLAGQPVANVELAQLIDDAECDLAIGVWGHWYSESELCSILCRDIPFYRATGGGVTLSGGEPLVHPILPLVAALQALEVKVAIETSLLAEASFLRAIAANVSLFIVDAKILDPEQCRRILKASLDVFYRNLSVLRECGAEVLLRIPLVAGITDREDNISKIAELIDDFRLSRVELLPVHNFAQKKAIQLGLPFSEFEPPSRNRIESIIAQLSATSAAIRVLRS